MDRRPVWVANQPMVVGGAEKCLKTSIVADAGISMATATPFLGTYEVPEALNVGILSGESGEATLQETAARICGAKGINLEDIGNLHWCTDLPSLESLTDVDLLKRRIREHELHVVVIDPAYLAMDLEGREASMFAVGKMLRRAARACQEEGASPAIVHHTNSTDEARQFREPRLQDLAYGGFKQFARQYLLLSRRGPYRSGSGEHKLWAAWGGRLGHGDTIAMFAQADLQES